MSQNIKISVLFLIFSVLFLMRSYSQTVYVQENGKKYHMKNCSVGGTGKKGMSIAEAKKLGYTPCKVCKPDEAMNDKTKPAEKPKEQPKTGEAKKSPTPGPSPAKPK